MNDIKDKIEVMAISDQPLQVRFLLSPYKAACYFTKDDQKIYISIKNAFGIAAHKVIWRYVCLIIDRTDGRVKIIEFPHDVYEQIGEYYEMTGKNPGSAKEGCDFIVKKDNITFEGETPLTQDEKEIVKEILNQDKNFVPNYYADISISEEEFEKILKTEGVEHIEKSQALIVPEIPWDIEYDPFFQGITKDTIDNLHYLLNSKEYHRNGYDNQEFINLEAYKTRLKMEKARRGIGLNEYFIKHLKKQFEEIIQGCEA